MKKKAAVYTLDAMLAILVAVIAIVAANNYFDRATYNKMLIAQPVEVASDTKAVMQKQDILEDFYLTNKCFFNNSIKDKKEMNNGTLQGNAMLDTKREDYSKFWLELDGSNSYVNISDNDNMSFNNEILDTPFSISAWIMMDDATNFTIMSKNSSSDKEWVFGTNKDDRLGLWLYDDDESAVLYKYTSNSITSNESLWVHVAATYDGNSDESGINISIDGTYPLMDSHDDADYYSMENTNQDVYIGRMQDKYADGLIDDIRIFNKELTPTEINDLKQNETVAEGNLIGEYDMDVETSNLNNSIDTYLPSQYDMVIRLYDSEGNIISNSPRPEPSKIKNFIASKDSIMAINKSNQIIDIIKVKHYAWTR